MLWQFCWFDLGCLYLVCFDYFDCFACCLKYFNYAFYCCCCGWICFVIYFWFWISILLWLVLVYFVDFVNFACLFGCLWFGTCIIALICNCLCCWLGLGFDCCYLWYTTLFGFEFIELFYVCLFVCVVFYGV